MEEEKNMPENHDALPVKNSAKPGSIDITTADETKLINETLESIQTIYQKGYIETMLNVGKLIFEKICENDVACFNSDQAKSGNVQNKLRLFKQLACESDKLYNEGQNFPGKTWLYNSVRLVAEQKLFADSSDYVKLSISHKIELLPIDDKNEKLELSKMINCEKMSVRKTRKYVSQSVPRKHGDRSISYCINNPDEIENEDSFFEEKIKATITTAQKKASLLNNCTNKIVEIEKQISEDTGRITKLKALMQRLNEFKPSNKRKRKEKDPE